MLDSLWNSISDFLGNTLSSILEAVLNATIFRLCYIIEAALCRLINIFSQLFEVFAGVERASYNGKHDFLMNIFFSNRAINNVYWAMALIGIALTFAFTIWAVIKKLFDMSGKMQASYGQILTAAVRSIVLMVSLSFIMNVVITSTNVLMQQITYIFNDAEHLDQPVTRRFSEEEYAAMGRILATVGNYSMVPNNNNRYNLNLCFNDIRDDLYYLERQGVFEYSYYQTDKNGNVIESWQSILAKIAKAGNLTQDVKVDVYNDGIASSIMDAMKYLQNNDNIMARETVKRDYMKDNDMHLDRLVFLVGTMRAAKNPQYNQNPSLDDPLRGPYYYDQGGNIYDFDQVSDDFDIGFKMDYVVAWIAAVAMIFDLVVILMNCVARLFNMMFLYIIAPPVIAAAPLDGGGKFKQWTIAFLVQSLSVFGTVIAMRLLMIYLPIVINPQLVLFEGDIMNMFAKFGLVFGGFEAAKKSTALLTGILADSAGWQAIQAGDMSSSASSAIGKVVGVGKAVGGTALSVGKSVGGFALKPATNLVKRPFKAAGDWWSKLGSGERQSRESESIKNRISQGKADEEYLKTHEEHRKYLQPNSQGGGPGGGGGGQPPNQNNPNQPPNQNNQNQPPNQNNQNNQNDPNNQNNQNQQQPPGGGGGGGGQPPQAPPLPPRYAADAPAEGAGTDDFRRQHGMGLEPGEGPKPAPREAPLPTRNRPTL